MRELRALVLAMLVCVAVGACGGGYGGGGGSAPPASAAPTY